MRGAQGLFEGASLPAPPQAAPPGRGVPARRATQGQHRASDRPSRCADPPGGGHHEGEDPAAAGGKRHQHLPVPRLRLRRGRRLQGQDAELKGSIPFAVVGSNDIVRETKGKAFRGRTYPWGAVEVENPAHCDFLRLRTMLVRTHMQDLKEVTQEIHYENYRAHCIQSLTRVGARDRGSRMKLSRQSATELPLLPLAETDTEKLIREKDEELRRMQEMLQKMHAQIKQSQGEQSDTL
ncbi:unnamed protein product [Eretmochelys imbricata]